MMKLMTTKLIPEFTDDEYEQEISEDNDSELEELLKKPFK